MKKRMASLLVFALVVASPQGCASRSATVNILGQKIAGNHLFIRLESLVDDKQLHSAFIFSEVGIPQRSARNTVRGLSDRTGHNQYR